MDYKVGSNCDDEGVVGDDGDCTQSDLGLSKELLAHKPDLSNPSEY